MSDDKRMNIGDEAVEAAWSELARGMDCDPDDRGAFESQLLDALTSALNAAAPHLMAAQQAKLDAVRELHKPDDEGDCTHCADYFCDTRKAEYPCPTIQAIRSAGAGE